MKCQFYSHTNISNFQSKYINGNKINKNGLRVCHWNKSHSKMQSRMAEIKNIVHLYKPHLFGVSEANFLKNEDISSISLQDYNIYFAPASQNGVCLLVYVHKSIHVKLRQDLMSPELSSVWLETKLFNGKKILVNQFYR